MKIFQGLRKNFESWYVADATSQDFHSMPAGRGSSTIPEARWGDGDAKQALAP